MTPRDVYSRVETRFPRSRIVMDGRERVILRLDVVRFVSFDSSTNRCSVYERI